MQRLSEVEKRFVTAFLLLSGLCLGLMFFRIALTGTSRYLFIPQNLALAWLALISSWILIRRLKASRWLDWRNLALTLMWLIFLPNCWYVLTDFIHVNPVGEISQLFDVVLVFSLVTVGFALGFASLFLVHQQLARRLSFWRSWAIVSSVILLSSFAIYLGRDLRWNSWDVVSNPGGLVINISDRILDPFGHPRSINVTSLHFILITTMYIAVHLAFAPKSKKSR